MLRRMLGGEGAASGDGWGGSCLLAGGSLKRKNFWLNGASVVQEPGLQAGRASGCILAAIWAARELGPSPRVRGSSSHGRRPIHGEDAAVMHGWRNEKVWCNEENMEE